MRNAKPRKGPTMTKTAAMHAMNRHTAVCAGTGDDYDVGYIIEADYRRSVATVAWQSGVRTQAKMADLRFTAPQGA